MVYASLQSEIHVHNYQSGKQIQHYSLVYTGKKCVFNDSGNSKVIDHVTCADIIKKINSIQRNKLLDRPVTEHGAMTRVRWSTKSEKWALTVETYPWKACTPDGSQCIETSPSPVREIAKKIGRLSDQ